jgi:hypothetical protein
MPRFVDAAVCPDVHIQATTPQKVRLVRGLLYVLECLIYLSGRQVQERGRDQGRADRNGRHQLARHLLERVPVQHLRDRSMFPHALRHASQSRQPDGFAGFLHRQSRQRDRAAGAVRGTQKFGLGHQFSGVFGRGRGPGGENRSWGQLDGTKIH